MNRELSMARPVLSMPLFFALMMVAMPVLAQTNAPQNTIPPQIVAQVAVSDDTAQVTSPAPIGTVIESEGTGNMIFRAAEPGKAYPVQNGDVIYTADIMQTGPQAKMLVVFIDDSRFTLGENARFRVDEYAYDDLDPNVDKARYNVMQGNFLYVSGLIAKQLNPGVRIQTPMGSLGIRGTTVWSGVLDSQYSVYVADGEVTLETNRGRIRMTGGEGSVIRSINAVPERPTVWNTEKVDRVKSGITLKNTDAVKERMTAHKGKQQDMLARHKDHLKSQKQDRIGQQKPRDTLKRLENKPHNPHGSPVANRPDIAETPAPAPQTENAPAPVTVNDTETIIQSAPAATSPAAAKTLNNADAPLPDAVPTTATGAAAASAPPPGHQESPVNPPAPDGFNDPVKPTEESQPIPTGATPSIIIEAPAAVANEPVEQGKDVVPPAFPAPAPVIQPAPENLPSDPAMRQEALEKLNLQNPVPANNPL